MSNRIYTATVDKSALLTFIKIYSEYQNTQNLIYSRTVYADIFFYAY